MSTRLLQRLIPAALLLLVAFQLVPAQRKLKPPRDGITGNYRFRSPSAENSLDAQRLPGGKVKIYLYASWIGNAAMGNVRNGEIRETLSLKNNVAVYESGQCRITILFTGRRAIVTQSEDDCGFGLNVLADGSYRKRNSRTPKFDF
jgi:hypothetical protein